MMVKISPFAQEIEVFLGDLKSPAAKSRRLAEFAEEGIREIKEQNAGGSGQIAPHKQFVDGREGAPLASVKPDGVIVAEFDLVGEVLEWIGEQLLIESPRVTGRYMQSHLLFLDNVEHVPGPITKEFAEAAFVNVQPYARKIERGQSDQAPEGVYEGIAALAAKRFGNVARIRYSFRDVPVEGATERNPAIIVRPF